MKTVGIDIGGTKMAAGVVLADGTLSDACVIPTPGTGAAEAVTSAAHDIVATLRTAHPDVAAVGVGAAGLVEWPSGRMKWGPHTTFQDLPLGERLAASTGLPVIVENDANAAVAAEVRFGSGKGKNTVVMLTIGTGIGGGLFLDGRLYRGPRGLGAEIGHMTVDPRGGPECACGGIGCLESRVSGVALARGAREIAVSEPDGMIARIAGSPDSVTGQVVHKAALAGDEAARALFAEMGYWLGVGIANLVTLLNPQLVILGGGIPAAVGDLLTGPTRESLGKTVFGPAHRRLPQVVLAGLGPRAGIIGAGLLASDAATRHHGVDAETDRGVGLATWVTAQGSETGFPPSARS